MFAHAQGKAAAYCRSNGMSPNSWEPNLLMFAHAQGEAAAYCRSNGMSPISLDSPAKEQEFTSEYIDQQNV